MIYGMAGLASHPFCSSHIIDVLSGMAGLTSHLFCSSHIINVMSGMAGLATFKSSKLVTTVTGYKTHLLMIES